MCRCEVGGAGAVCVWVVVEYAFLVKTKVFVYMCTDVGIDVCECLSPHLTGYSIHVAYFTCSYTVFGAGLTVRTLPCSVAHLQEVWTQQPTLLPQWITGRPHSHQPPQGSGIPSATGLTHRWTRLHLYTASRGKLVT